MVFASALVTTFFIYNNPELGLNSFFLNGGLLLIVTALFMIVLIQTRYSNAVKEIKARLALEASNLEIQRQAAEIQRINENLEEIVHERTVALKKKNKALEEYAFINAHKLRSPVASILGLIDILTKMDLGTESREVSEHLLKSARSMDWIVSDICRTI
mgnify:CR=1 FL=1